MYGIYQLLGTFSDSKGVLQLRIMYPQARYQILLGKFGRRWTLDHSGVLYDLVKY
jgi:hypothetical protein